MKIAMMVRGYIPAPRPSDIVYAPIDLAVMIGEGLAKRGHEVDFYGPKGTKLKVPVKDMGLRPLANTYKEFQSMLDSVDLLSYYMPGLWDQYLSQEMFQQALAGKYDILHFHHPETAIALAGHYPTVPVVYTVHDPIFDWYHEIYEMFHSSNQFYVSISNNQRLAAPQLPYAATVYNGVRTKDFPFSAKHDDYLLFVGRLTAQKGVKEAVEVARKTDQKLLIIGPTYQDSQVYFKKYVKPYLNDKIQYLGYIDHSQKLVRYIQRAKALLMPIQWEEPFGMTMIEAMSCGVPIIGLRRGSVAEVVEDGKTGFVVDTVAQMAAAVKKLDTIDRAACRQRVIDNFSVEKMVEGYEAAFETVLRKTR